MGKMGTKGSALQETPDYPKSYMEDLIVADVQHAFFDKLRNIQIVLLGLKLRYKTVRPTEADCRD